MIELLLQAERSLSVGQLDAAERLYWQAIENDPRNSIAVVGLARVALDRGDDRTAYQFARKALEIDAENVAAQRLVRRTCPACKEKVSVPEVLRKELWIDDPNAIFYRGAGCRACKQSGFSGRLGVFEMLTVTDSIRELIAGRASVTTLLAEARRQGMKLLRQDGSEKVLAGLTTVEEVLRVTSAGDFADIPKGELVSA